MSVSSDAGASSGRAGGPVLASNELEVLAFGVGPVARAACVEVVADLLGREVRAVVAPLVPPLLDPRAPLVRLADLVVLDFAAGVAALVRGDPLPPRDPVAGRGELAAGPGGVGGARLGDARLRAGAPRAPFELRALLYAASAAGAVAHAAVSAGADRCEELAAGSGLVRGRNPLRSNKKPVLTGVLRSSGSRHEQQRKGGGGGVSHLRQNRSLGL